MGDRFTWFAFDAADWLEGVEGLTYEEQGFYIAALAKMWRRKSRLPSDRAEFAALMGNIDKRTAGRLLSSLVRHGKLFVDGDSVGNRRMDKTLAEHANRADSASKREKDRANFRRTSGELPAKVSQKSGKLTANFEPHIEENQHVSEHEPSTSPLYIQRDIDRKEERKKDLQQQALNLEPASARAEPPKTAAAANRVKLDLLEAALLEAANGSLCDFAKNAGMLNLGPVLGWLSSGADLELDIAPAIRAIGKRDHGKQVKSWNYFSNAVAQNRDARLKGLPPVNGEIVKSADDLAAERNALFDKLCAKFVSTKTWTSHVGKWGSPPGKPGCLVPPGILAKHGLQSGVTA